MEELTNKYKDNLKKFKDRQHNYQQNKQELIDKAKKEYGEDIFTNFAVPKNFDFNGLNDNIFKERNPQKMAMPFSNETIDYLISTKKTVLNKVFNFSNRGHNVFGVYLKAKDKNFNDVIFALTIIRDADLKENRNFHIKLDFYAQGKTWFPLLRLDSLGSKHPNYIIDGKVADSASKIQFVATPHIHKNSEEAQVLSNKNLDYTTATHISAFGLTNLDSSDSQFFKKCLDKFLQYAKVDAKINQNIKEDYNYNYKDQLFDSQTMEQI